MEKVLTPNLMSKMCDQAFKRPIMDTTLPGRNDGQASGQRPGIDPVPANQTTDGR
jgi:hypothetical protein